MSFSLPFLGGTQKKDSLRLAVDVGFRHIYAAAFEVRRQEEGEGGLAFRIVKKIPRPLGSFYGSARVMEALYEVLFEVIRGLGKLPGTTWVSFAPEWVKTSLAVWNVPLAAKVPAITKKELGAYFKNILAAPENRTLAAGAQVYPFRILFNGYPADLSIFSSDENNGMIEEVGFRVLVSLFDEDVLGKLEEIRHMLGGVRIECVPRAFSLKEVITDMLKMRDAFAVDVGEQATSLALVKEGELQEIADFPAGSSRFGGALLTPRGSKRSAGDKKTAESWKEEFMNALDPMYHAGAFPERVLLLGAGARVPEIQEILRSPDWISGFSHAKSVQCGLFEPERVMAFDPEGEQVKGLEEADLAGLMYFAARHTRGGILEEM